VSDDDPKPPSPTTLDYFAPQAPHLRHQRTIAMWIVVLLVSWIPYLCGIVNAGVVARSYVPSITSASVNATIICMCIGIVVSATALVRFIMLRELGASLMAFCMVLAQVSIAACIGAARL
jgi:hypothetical protein